VEGGVVEGGAVGVVGEGVVGVVEGVVGVVGVVGAAVYPVESKQMCLTVSKFLQDIQFFVPKSKYPEHPIH